MASMAPEVAADMSSFCNSFTVNSQAGSYSYLHGSVGSSHRLYDHWCGQTASGYSSTDLTAAASQEMNPGMQQNSKISGCSAVWAQQVMQAEDSKACSLYGGSMASLLSTPTGGYMMNRARAPSCGNLRVQHMQTEGTMIRELIDRMGRTNNPATTRIPAAAASLGVSISHRPGHPMEKLLNLGSGSSSCSTAAGLSSSNVDPSKLAGVGRCLQFSSDPGFPDHPLAAKFSPFCSNASYSPAPGQQAVTIPLLTDDLETSSGSGGHSEICKLSPTSSTGGVLKVAGAGDQCIISQLEAATTARVQNRAGAGAQEVSKTTSRVIRIISDDQFKEPTGGNNGQHLRSLPSLEAIEGARKNSVAAAAGLEISFDPGVEDDDEPEESPTFSAAAGEPPLEKKRKKLVLLTPADHDTRAAHASSSPSSLQCPESVFDNDNTTKSKRCKMDLDAAASPRKSPCTSAKDQEIQKSKAEAGSSYNECNNSDNDSSQGTRSKEVNTAPSKSSHADLCKQDYIHVRARRGQATDSHSLAERIRREKISERMKHLQDLVPGCSKVTGKAVMLDEIINYVQSLQRQVEHLSMRLATVPPEMDVNFDTVSAKEMMQQSFGGTGPIDHTSFFNHNAKQQEPTVGPLDTIGAYAFDFSCSLNGNLETGSNCGVTQGSSMWDGDLQSIVQMGILQCGPTSLMSQGFNCHLPVSNIKVEL